jgi:signal transduction histidine kinase
LKVYKLYILSILLIHQAIGQHNVDSLKTKLLVTKGSAKIELLNQLTIGTWLNFPERAETYAKEALFLARISTDSAKISTCLRLLGGVFLYKGYALEGLDYNQQSLAIAVSIKDSALINSSLNNIGFTYYHLNNYQNALEYLLRSKHIKEATNDLYGLEHTLNNIGLVYQKAQDHERALDYFNLGYDQASQNNNKDVKIYSLNNSAASYIATRNYTKAEELLKQSLSIGENINNKIWTAITFFELAEIKFYQAYYDSAIYLVNKAIIMQKSINDSKGLAESHTLEAKIFIEQSRFDDALIHLQRSDELALSINNFEKVLSNYRLYKNLYMAKGKFEKANEYMEMYLKTRDDLYTDILRRNLSLIPNKIKEEGNKVKVQETELKLKNQKFQNLLYISFIILIVPFSLLLFIVYRRNIHKNRSLEKQNDTIEAQKEEIETQKEYMEENFKELETAKNLISSQRDELEILNKQLEGKVDASNSELKKVNETLKATSLELDNFIYKSSHDIKGPLVRLMGICSLALTEITEEKAYNYFIMLDKATKRLNFIIDELKFISELNSKVLTPTQIDFNEIIARSTNEIKYIENVPLLFLNTEVAEKISFQGDKELVNLIIFNLIQNSLQILKSEQIADKEIILRISKSQNELAITLDLIHLKLNLNEISQLVNSFSKANKEYNNLSIGLYTIILCVKKLSGSFEIKTGKDANTIFEVILPL